MTDRRTPLGGVDKDTFVDSAHDPALNAKLTFDLISGIKSDLCHEIKLIKADTEVIKLQCACRAAECKATYDMRYIKRVHPKIPLSIAEFIFYLVTVGALFGLGYKLSNLPLPIF